MKDYKDIQVFAEMLNKVIGNAKGVELNGHVVPGVVGFVNSILEEKNGEPEETGESNYNGMLNKAVVIKPEEIEEMFKNSKLYKGLASNVSVEIEDILGKFKQGMEEEVTGKESQTNYYEEHYLFSKLVNSIMNGGNILIVGDAGAGKTTLANELQGILKREYESGVLLIDSISTAEELKYAEQEMDEGEQVVATIQGIGTGGAINQLIRLAGGHYNNRFNVIVEMNTGMMFNGTGIKHVTIL